MQNRIQVWDKKPADFISKVDVAAAYVEVDGKLLLLQLSDHKSESKRWGVPAGKLEKEEALEDGLRRELFEETGIVLDASHRIPFLGSLYFRKPEIDYTYHLFKVDLPLVPQLSLSIEHSAYQWVPLEDAKVVALMDGAQEALEHYLDKSRKKRSDTSVNAYLILRKGNEILLHLRKNTGYCDGFYGVISGHVEDGESATTAIAREAFEEAGIVLDPSNIRPAHIMHRKTDRQNVDVFFECTSWSGIPTNQETEKCESLEFFSVDNLPAKTIDYIHDVLDAISRGECYSERGWVEERDKLINPSV